MKHLLKLADLTREEILSILNLADQLKYERKHGIFKDYLKGKKLGMIFQKSSTIFRSDAASPCRTPRGSFRAISMRS